MLAYRMSGAGWFFFEGIPGGAAAEHRGSDDMANAAVRTQDGSEVNEPGGILVFEDIRYLMTGSCAKE